MPMSRTFLPCPPFLVLLQSLKELPSFPLTFLYYTSFSISHTTMINLLPSELLCKIFITSLSDTLFDHCDRDSYMSNSNGNDLSMRITPFTFTAVCRHWRFVASAEPRLWSTVYLLVAPSTARRQASLMDTIFSRSGDCPLSLELDCDYQIWMSDNAHFALPLLEVTSNYSARITTFRTRLPPICLLFPEETNIPHPHFARLTTLHLVPEWVPEDEEDMDIGEEDDDDMDLVDPGHEISLFRHSNNVTHLEIRQLNLPQILLGNWSRLTNFKAYMLELADCYQVLYQAPNLESAEFHNILYSTFDPEEPIPTPLYLSHLNFLTLDLRESGIADTVLSNITAPHLKVLEYITEVDPHVVDFPVQDFIHFIHRSHCELEELLIMDPALTDWKTLLSILEVIRATIVHLRINLLPNNPNHFNQTRPTFIIQGFLNLWRGKFPNIRSGFVGGPTEVVFPLNSFLTA